MSGYCPAGEIKCESFNTAINSKNLELGRCSADKEWFKEVGINRVLLKTDERCPCPKQQKVIEGRFERAWSFYSNDVLSPDSKNYFMDALKKAGLKDE